MNIWHKWSIAVWIVLTVLVVGFELWSNFNGSQRTPTLTDVTIRYMPSWVIIPFLVWLLLHFSINYAATSKLLRWFVQ